MRTMQHWLVAAMLAAPTFLSAQNTGEIHGKVVDENGVPQEFVSLRAEQAGTVFTAETDIDGRYVLKPLPIGVYSVKAILTGMNTVEVAAVRVDPGLNTNMNDIVMAPPAMGEVIVVAYRWEEPLIRKDDPSRMVMTSGQIKSNAGRKDPVGMIGKSFAGVTQAANGDGLYFRGSRTDAMCYFVDGVKMTRLTGVPPDAINTISVYTGGLPAKYGDVTGGVVAIETKSYFDLYQQRNTEQCVDRH